MGIDEIDRLRDALKQLKAENETLREHVAKLDSQLGQRPCQFDRCIRHAKLCAENGALKDEIKTFRVDNARLREVIAQASLRENKP